jgi:hypothetical protein
MIRTITKRMVLMAAVAACFTALPAQAETARFHVPFPFLVSGKALPAGSYLVDADRIQGHLTIRAMDASGGAFANLIPAERSGGPAEKGILQFHRYGATHVLKTLQFRGRVQGFELPQTKLERELEARLGAPGKVVSVAAAE